MQIKERLEFCSACQYGKSHKLPFPRYESQASKPLQLIHTDLWRLAPHVSKNGFKYYIIFVDDYSRFTWIYPLTNKSEALPIFIQFKTLVVKQFDTQIKIVQSDSGGEDHAFATFVKQQGIIHCFTCPYTSSQNARTERKIRHITETGLTLLAQAQLPLFD